MSIDQPFGPVRRWREGDRYYAENDFVRMVYVVADDPEKAGNFGRLGLHGPDQMCVEFVTADVVKNWVSDGASAAGTPPADPKNNLP